MGTGRAQATLGSPCLSGASWPTRSRPGGTEGTLDCFPLAQRKIPVTTFKSLQLLWTMDGSNVAVYGCVTVGKLLTLSVPISSPVQWG